MNILSKRKFAKPEKQFCPGYFWIWRYPLVKERLIAQLREMHRNGVRSICIHPCPKGWMPDSGMTPDYLTSAYWSILRVVVAECARLDMNFWLYDEGGYPSGSACGRVYRNSPERFAMKQVVRAPDGNIVVHSSVPNDFSNVRACYPNLLTPGATEKFISLTHETFRKIAGRHFGDTIRFAFMDEPVAPRSGVGYLTWTDDLGSEFKKRKGYAVEDYFAVLLQGPKDGEPENTTRTRIDFYDVWSQLFVERFLDPIRVWCRKNGLLSSGHFGGEDQPGQNADGGWGHILRALRGLDAPGVDVIWRQLYPPTKEHPVPELMEDPFHVSPRKTEPVYVGPRLHPFTKYASSVARQSGCPYVLSETFAVYGSGLKPDVMKWVTDYQCLCGATQFVLSNITQSPVTGSGMAGCRPHFEISPFWKYFDLYHAYASRLCSMLSCGRPICGTAFYFDIRSIWAGASIRDQAVRIHEQTAESLMRRRCDFDFIDDDVLAEGRVSKGTLRIGKMTYDTIVMPPTRWLTPEAASNLKAFLKSGGKVLAPEELDTLKPVVKIFPETKDIFAVKRRDGDKVVYFLMNGSCGTVDATITLPEKGVPVYCDPSDGRFYALKLNRGKLRWRFEPYGSLLVAFGLAPDLEYRFFRPGKKHLTPHSWTIRPTWSLYPASDVEYKTDSPDTEPVECRPGDWRPVLGEFFSGDALYKTEFECPVPGGEAELDLGEVCYSCTVFLNGKQVGRKFWGPFRFKMDGMLGKGMNTLEIQVSNTLANAIANPETEACWNRSFQRTPYENITRTYEKDSLRSGLFGPVVIRFGDYSLPPAEDTIWKKHGRKDIRNQGRRG